MDSLFAIIGLGAGVYCIYAYVMMRTKGEINKTIFIPKDLRLMKCKDEKGYIKDTSLSLLILGIVLLLYAGIEIINKYVMSLRAGLGVALFLVAAALVWFATVTKKANKKYFGM